MANVGDKFIVEVDGMDLRACSGGVQSNQYHLKNVMWVSEKVLDKLE